MSAAMAGSDVAMTVEAVFSMNRATATISGTVRSRVMGWPGAPRSTSWCAARCTAARCIACGTRPSRHRDVGHLFRHVVTLLDGRPLGDGQVPPLHVGVLVEVDRLPLEAGYPRPYRNVGDGIIVGDEFAVGEAPVEHAVEPVRLLEVALLRIGRLALVVFHEVVDLAEHRARAAHLPHQPL